MGISVGKRLHDRFEATGINKWSVADDPFLAFNFGIVFVAIVVLNSFLRILVGSAEEFEAPFLPGNPIGFPVKSSALYGKCAARVYGVFAEDVQGKQ